MYRDYVGKRPGRHDPDFALLIEHDRSAGSCTLNGIHRLHAELCHSHELIGDRLGPRNTAHIGAEHDFHAGFESFLE